MRILVAAARPPWPVRRGDQLRARQLVEALAAQHAVTLLAPAAAGEPPPPANVRRETFRARPAALAVLGSASGLLLRGWPLQALPFRQPDLGRRLRELAPQHDRVVLLLARLLPHLEDAAGPPLVVDLVDCLSLNVATRAAVDQPALRPLLALEAGRLRRAEGRLLAAAGTTLVVADRDRQALAAAHPELAPRLAVAPIAIAGTAAPARAASSPGPPTVALTGNLGYFPNRDAARWFLATVWPALRSAVPGVQLLLAGDRPPAALVRQAARAGASLVPRPADLRALLATTTVAVAPVRCGSGVPLKVLDAWAAGVPVVASPFAAAGAAGERERDLLVASAPEDWVAQLTRLLADPTLRAALVDGGRARVAALAPERVYPLVRRLVTGDAG